MCSGEPGDLHADVIDWQAVRLASVAEVRSNMCHVYCLLMSSH